MNEETPRPGTKEAIDKGCLCPVSDNNDGAGIPMTDPETKEVRIAYWMAGNCPLHGIKDKE